MASRMLLIIMRVNSALELLRDLAQGARIVAARARLELLQAREIAVHGRLVADLGGHLGAYAWKVGMAGRRD